MEEVGKTYGSLVGNKRDGNIACISINFPSIIDYVLKLNFPY
jgi:hypothetical protein